MSIFDDARAAGDAAERKIIEDAFSRVQADLVLAQSDDVADDALIAAQQAEIQRLEELLAAVPAPPENPKLALSAIREFPHYMTKAYQHHDRVLSDLDDIGLKRISAQLNHDTPAASIRFYERAYKEFGIQLWATIGTPRVRWTPEQWEDLEAILDGPLNGAVAMAANWNEPQHRRSTNDPATTGWPQLLAEQQVELAAVMRPRGIPVGTGQLHSGNIPDHAGYVKQMFEANNGAVLHHSDLTTVHLYPRGGVGEDLIDRFYTMYEAYTGKRLMLCTEAGYSNSMNSTQGTPVTAEQSGVLVPLLFEAWHKRGGGLALFEHYDDPDPEENDREFNFGIVEVPNIANPSTWTNKPAYHSLKQYLAA